MTERPRDELTKRPCVECDAPTLGHCLACDRQVCLDCWDKHRGGHECDNDPGKEG